MNTTFIGTTFSPASDWHTDENQLIANVRAQIDQSFSHSRNLLINTTWFGPQFANRQWDRYKKTISQQQFDRVFMLASVDPVFLNPNQLADIQQETHSQMYLLGNFDTQYYFNFFSQLIPRYFVSYTDDQVTMKQPTHVFLNYNRKPREHRCEFVNQLIKTGAIQHGVATLGKQDTVFSKDVIPLQHLTLNETVDDAVGNWGMSMDLGIPHDIHSLGNLDIWQQHFLNIVGETEFWPWDNMFLSEKTFKPILGLRPFVINGQQKIYQYLRSQGFKTFNSWWPHIDIENGNVHETILQLIEYLHAIGAEQRTHMYQQMLPDLLHNRDHFFHYVQQQQYKINHLFE
jgi:hypothetical protein